MTAELHPHPRSDRDVVRLICVTIERDMSPEILHIRYWIEGDIDRLSLPLPEGARRRDSLWQHTCFEVFLQPDASQGYYEFNFAPSGDWAAYRFGSRRSERSLPDLRAPSIEFLPDAEHCELTASVSLTALPELASASLIRAGVAAVVETRDGMHSHWALAHAGPEPDFHDPASFTLHLAPP